MGPDPEFATARTKEAIEVLTVLLNDRDEGLRAAARASVGPDLGNDEVDSHADWRAAVGLAIGLLNVATQALLLLAVEADRTPQEALQEVALRVERYGLGS